MLTLRLLTSLFIYSFVSVSDCHNILVLFPHFGKSHFLVFEDLFRTLAEKGHNVTVISFFPQKNPIPNYRDIPITTDTQLTGFGVLGMDMFGHPKHVMYTGADFIANLGDYACKTFLAHPNLQKFLKEDNSFDLVMVELFNTNCHLGLANKFKAPIIGVSSSMPLPWFAYYFGQPDNPAYIPNILLGFNDKMTFFERTEHFLVLLYHKYVWEFRMRRPGIELSKKFIGEDPEEAWENLNMMLVNLHFTATRPRPLVPSLINIAGLHIEEKKPLPKDLEKYINESQNGVIFMSMGSMMKGTSFPKDKQQHYLKAFSKISQNVLWKWESDTMDGKPPNVKLIKWAPQRSLICHPNVKVFITHGGLLGTLEAMHCGIPLLVIPHFGDQYSNAAAIEANGNGVVMWPNEATEEKILENLKKVLSEQFRKQVKSQSEQFRDRPISPKETALYWIEYVLRHKGAKFMRTAAARMPTYQYYLIDVIAFILFVLLISIICVHKLVLLVYRRVFHEKLKVKKS